MTALLICMLGFAETKTLALQIRLDQEACSCNAIDGQWGEKSATALRAYCDAKLRDPVPALPSPSTPEEAYDRLFAGRGKPLRTVEVTERDLAALVRIPAAPADKAKLDAMGYESLPEMFAERGHLSRRAFERLNPGVDWENARPGLKVVLPEFDSIESLIAFGSRPRGEKPRPYEATLIRVNLSRFTIRAYGEDGRLLASFPCSIARDKSKVPQGELKIVTLVPWPNYTYTPDHAGSGRVTRHILPPGPNNPVGVAWMGLSLPGYGIHGTPTPESVGCAESHGCFRLANWNAARLFAIARIGTRVIIEP